jgi:hypothetical protein
MEDTITSFTKGKYLGSKDLHVSEVKPAACCPENTFKPVL